MVLVNHYLTGSAPPVSEFWSVNLLSSDSITKTWFLPFTREREEKKKWFWPPKFLPLSWWNRLPKHSFLASCIAGNWQLYRLLHKQAIYLGIWRTQRRHLPSLMSSKALLISSNCKSWVTNSSTRISCITTPLSTLLIHIEGAFSIVQKRDGLFAFCYLITINSTDLLAI